MQNNKHALWTEKYRPQTIEGYVFHDAQQRASIMRMIEDGSIPHLLFSGSPGCGKTTLAQLLIRYMDVDPMDVITINASDERGIDTFRDNIKNFAETVAMSRFKIIHLEECDALTPLAQQALKRFMEETCEYVRFILTCNHSTKVIPPVRSRCQEFHFKAADPVDIAEYVYNILTSENIKFRLDLLDKYVAYGYPDVRKIVNLLQQNSVNGELQTPVFDSETGDYKFKLIELIEQDKWNEARKLVCANVIADEWEHLYRFMYENIYRSPKFKDSTKHEESIVVIAEYLYKHAFVADPEINAAACFITLGHL